MAFFDWVNDVDVSLFKSLNGFHTSLADGFWWMVSDTITWVPLFLAIIILLVKNKGRESFILLLMLALTVLLADQFSVLIKDLVGRLRPSRDPSLMYDVHIVNGYRGGLYSFVSSHAANTFGVAVFLSLVVRNFWFSLTMLLWAAMNGFSRIYLGVHFPFDILMGAVLGSLIGWGDFLVSIFVIDRMPAFSSLNTERNLSTFTHSGYKKTSIFAVVIVFVLSIFFFILSSSYILDFMS